MRRFLRYFAIAILVLLGIMFGKSFFAQSGQLKIHWQGKPTEDFEAVQHLSQSIQFASVSYDNEEGKIKRNKALFELRKWMQKTYPFCFKNANLDTLSGGSMVLYFKGTNSKSEPIIMLAHLDVVPADSADLKYWKFPPFSGKIDHDTIYGRGALDDKVIAISMLEAMEKILIAGKLPSRNVIFAFGQDEETGGKEGARQIAALLKRKNIHAAFIMDEGLGVTEGIVPGIAKPTALIGIAEKGYASIKLTVKMDGGHSSMPKKENAASVLTSALNKIDKHRFDEKFPLPLQEFLSQGASEMSFGYKFLFSNMWITSPLVKMVMRGNEKTLASISTTHATTLMQAGVKDNVIPNLATATVNFRILSGETVGGTLQEAKDAVKDARVLFEVLEGFNDPSMVSPINGAAWQTIRTAIHETFKNVVTLPGQVLAGTDCKHYTQISTHIYRFTPLRLNNNNTGGIHGINERIAVNNYMECIAFYRNLFEKP